MHILIIDTATERGVVAGLTENSTLFKVELPVGPQNAQLLLTALRQELQAKQLKVEDFDAIAVGVGPGSYTGIRVGAIVAKTLAFAKGVPLVGVGSLEGFVPSKEGMFAAVIDAKIGGVYVQTGRYDGGKIERGEPQVLSLSEAVEILKGYSSLVTPASQLLRQKLEAEGLSPQIAWEERYPFPERLFVIAQDKFQRGEFDREGNLSLLYMRKTQAEIEREAKNKGQYRHQRH